MLLKEDSPVGFMRLAFYSVAGKMSDAQENSDAKNMDIVSAVSCAIKILLTLPFGMWVIWPGCRQELQSSLNLYCGEACQETAAGCATQGGRQIAIIAEAFRGPAIREDIVALHEIGHTLGLNHDDSQPNHVMNEKVNGESVGIQKDECLLFSSKKNYVTPDPFEI